jgi:hypothetical protein
MAAIYVDYDLFRGQEKRRKGYTVKITRNLYLLQAGVDKGMKRYGSMQLSSE